MKSIDIKVLDERATIPTRSHPTDSGLDLYALEDVFIGRRETALVPTGIAVDIPPGYEGQVRPRSGKTLNTSLRVQLGTIDSGYNSDVGIIVDNLGHPHDQEWRGEEGWQTEGMAINAGDKIAQLVISPIVTPKPVVVNEFKTSSERGSNGFGSTDNKRCPECGSTETISYADVGIDVTRCSQCDYLIEVIQP